MKAQLITRANYRCVPWKNGLGFTEEIHREPADLALPFHWRLSIATVAQNGAFSPFDGYLRIISVLDGAGMSLQIDGVDSSPILPFQAFPFSGSAQTSCTLLEGEIHDFNVIFDADRVSAEVIWHQASSFVDVIIAPNEDAFILCAGGEAECSIAETIYQLKHWDGLLISGATKPIVHRVIARSSCYIGVVVIKYS
jgi:uncharacterized protein